MKLEVEFKMHMHPVMRFYTIYVSHLSSVINGFWVAENGSLAAAYDSERYAFIAPHMISYIFVVEE